MHGCWEERGCSNEGCGCFRTVPLSPAFACWLMGLFGMPPLLDSEWWSAGYVPLCLSPLWRLKGDRYLDTVPRLNDWNGMEKALSEPRGGHLPSQGDWAGLELAWKLILTVFNGNDIGSVEFGVIFSRLTIQLESLQSALVVCRTPSNQISVAVSSKLSLNWG